MKTSRKTSLAVAVSAAIGAAVIAPAAHAWSVDVLTGNLETSSGGDTLLFPLYSTAVGASTSFSTTNIGGSTIAAKIRFREQDHSMDVLDFIVVYSAYDKFDFSVSQGEGDATPVMRWNDTSCVVGPAAGGVQPFPAPSNFVENTEVMSVGHVEMLGMANLDQVCWNPGTNQAAPAPCPAGFVNLGAAGTHVPGGPPANCDLLVSVLGNQSNVAAINAALGIDATVPTGLPLAYDVPNDLIGRFVISDAAGGVEAGGDAVAIQNSNFVLSAQSAANCAAATLPNGGGAVPSINCWRGYEWDANEWDHPHFGDMVNLANFQTALTATSVAGDWSNNPANSVGVDWIVSFPSKYAYLGFGTNDCASTSLTSWCLLANTRPRTTPTFVPGHSNAWTSGNTADLCLNNANPQVWDSEENRASGNVTVSPGAQTELDICPELGVYTLAPVGAEVRPSLIQTEARREIVSFQNLDAIRGWGVLSLNWGGSTGGAVNALNFTTRATVDPAFANGSLTTLQKN